MTARMGATLVGAWVLCACSAQQPLAHTVVKPPATAATAAGSSSSARRAFGVGGFARPASVLYDEFRDRYLVSNINGPLPGFLSVVAPDGRVVSPRAIDSLRDPHGMGILDGILYVADVATVRTFYLADGAPASDIEIMTATLLNDVAVDPVAGRVFVSDTAMLPAADGSYKPNGGDAIYVIEKRQVRPLAQGPDLRNPSGLASDGAGGVWVVDGDGRVYRIDAAGAMVDVARGPGKSLDGIVLLGTRMFVSDWDSGTVWERDALGRWLPVVHGIMKPADIGLDTKRRRLLVPSIQDGILEGWDL
jgi:DNA-binding beta-propeller fold protein YncE